MDKQYIVLNIGGRLFKTKITTLTSINDSYFQQLFTTEWDRLLDSNGHLFIDRDGDIFPIILGYLRHGKSYPLPVDDYKLNLIIYESQFYKLPELIKTAEKVQSYIKRNFIPLKAPVILGNPISKHYSRQRFKNMLLMKGITPTPVLSIPTISSSLPRKSNTDGETLLRQFSRKLPRKHDKDKIEIGAPNEFKHIIHIGRADNGHKIIVDNSNEQTTLKAIVQPICDEISTLPAIYSLIDADENENHSDSVEIFFAGSTIQAYQKNLPLSASQKILTNLQTGLYDNCCFEISRSDVIEKSHAIKIKNSPVVTDI